MGLLSLYITIKQLPVQNGEENIFGFISIIYVGQGWELETGET